MNHYPHHIGDFEAETRHLSRLERSIYRDMRDMYFKNECPLDGSNLPLLARRLLCTTDEEVAAMHFVLSEFFDETEDGQFVNERCDREIAMFQASQAGRGTVKNNENERKRRSRIRRAAMFSALEAAGVPVEGLSTMKDLYKAFRDNGIPLPTFVYDAPSVTPHVTPKGVTCHTTGTGNQNQNHNQLIPPNPPAGGTDADRDSSGQRDGEGGQHAGPDPMALATSLFAFFPVHCRTRVRQVSGLLAELLQAGTVTGSVVLEAASRQSEVLSAKEGKACPSVLRWLRESRWLDSVVDMAAGGTVSPNWRESRSGIEAMGARVGMLPFDASGYRLMAQYEAEVDRRLQADEVAA